MRSLMLASASVFALGFAASAASAQGLPYPSYTPYQIKSLGLETRDDSQFGFVGNGIGHMATNLFWPAWEGGRDTTLPCASPNFAYGGHCFTPDAGADGLIKEYSDAGVVITAVVIGVPAWAQTTCHPGNQWCTPSDPADFARFAGMLANRYNGLNGHGRVANFILHNEVNARAYYDDGCGLGGSHPPCTVDGHAQRYADDFNASDDAIKSEQAAAKVLISITKNFGGPDDPAAVLTPAQMISTKSYLQSFATRVGAREWHIALHAYAADDNSPVFP
jgi:hypothetical protein